MKRISVHMKPYIQPFEKKLAMREIESLVGQFPIQCDNGSELGNRFEILTDVSADELATRLAYWELLEVDGHLMYTDQSLRESTVNVVRNGIPINTLRNELPFKASIPLPNRRCLRYGTHGLHEYRGKFFPQLVRSLINISGVGRGGVIADPMSGSGTTVVESVLSGCNGFGLDMNPLSVFIGNTKVKLLTVDPEVIASSYQAVREALLGVERRKQKLMYLESLPSADQKYLSSWFSEDVLRGLDDIVRTVENVENDVARDFMKVSLSNIVRSVSWQKDEDLRVRKDIRLDVETDPKREFLVELGRSTRAVLAFLYQCGSLKSASYSIVEGDARNCSSVWGRESVDAIITSPPYATALPYLDTDRLSLCYLGLLNRSEHRIKDKEMIGNREVSEGIRKNYWEYFESNRDDLPKSVSALVERIHLLNSTCEVGFRRKNLPALLSKYFFDMKDVLEGSYNALKPGSFAYYVVGNNHTIAGGNRVEIETASLLQDIADSIGFEITERFPMEMLLSRDIFKKNAMASEDILCFRKR